MKYLAIFVALIAISLPARSTVEEGPSTGSAYIPHFRVSASGTSQTNVHLTNVSWDNLKVKVRFYGSNGNPLYDTGGNVNSGLFTIVDATNPVENVTSGPSVELELGPKESAFIKVSKSELVFGYGVIEWESPIQGIERTMLAPWIWLSSLLRDSLHLFNSN